MKRKVLALLLTLTLVLSYMPMIAFADVEQEEDPVVNELVETEDIASEPGQAAPEEEGTISDEPVQLEPETDEAKMDEPVEATSEAEEMLSKGEGGSVVTANSDADDEDEECAHEDFYIEEEGWDTVDYIDTGDDKYHHASGTITVIKRCWDCEKELSRETYQVDENRQHDYDEDGVCVVCNHKNTCTHEHTDIDKDWDPDEVKYIPVDNQYHRVVGPGYEMTWCEDCGMELSREPIQIADEYYHYYEDGVCEECGYENTCTHERIDTFESWDRDDVDCFPIDSKYHRVVGPGYEITECRDCGEELSREPIQIDDKY